MLCLGKCLAEFDKKKDNPSVPPSLQQFALKWKGRRLIQIGSNNLSFDYSYIGLTTRIPPSYKNKQQTPKIQPQEELVPQESFTQHSISW